MTQGKYANVNCLNLYYETYGTGKPLVLLHGGFGSTGMFAPILPALAENRQVIAVDLQGNGRTADIDRPFSFELMADDIAGLIRRLELDKVDVAGFSLGGGVALQTTIRHPDAVRKLVLVSTPYKRDGWYPEMREGMASLNAEAMAQTPLYQAYVSIAPKPEDWPALVTKTRNLLAKDYDWSTAVAAIKTPTMIVVGDADGLRPAHAVQFFELLGGGKRDAGWDGSGMSDARLAILPGLTHYNIFSSPLLASTVTPFLDAPMPGTSRGR
jgi:pimeloyl-ACP methyl ester carboxylesterase